MARTAVARAKKYCPNVEFSPMDATRSDPHYVYTLVEECIAAGATTVNIPDTVGYAIPHEFEAFIRSIQENVPNIHKAVISVHCHNDLGLAVANSLAAVRAGARQVECTINGIGERAGNASLEEVVMGIKTRHDLFGLSTNVDTHAAPQDEPPGIRPDGNGGAAQQGHRGGQRLPPPVGRPPARHPQDAGDLRDHGRPRRGPAPRRHPGAQQELRPPRREGAAGRAGLRSDHAPSWTASSWPSRSWPTRRARSTTATWRRWSPKSGAPSRSSTGWTCSRCPAATNWCPRPPCASSGRTASFLVNTAVGTGPVDATYKAISCLLNVPNELTEFAVKSVTEGIDAIGEVTVRIESDGQTFVGRGGDTDIIVASAKALLNALNHLLSTQGTGRRGGKTAPSPSKRCESASRHERRRTCDEAALPAARGRGTANAGAAPLALRLAQARRRDSGGPGADHRSLVGDAALRLGGRRHPPLDRRWASRWPGWPTGRCGSTSSSTATTTTSGW